MVAKTIRVMDPEATCRSPTAERFREEPAPAASELEVGAPDRAVVEPQYELAAAAGPVAPGAPQEHVARPALAEHELAKPARVMSRLAARRLLVGAAGNLRHLRPAVLDHVEALLSAQLEANGDRHTRHPAIGVRPVAHRPEEALEFVDHPVDGARQGGVAGDVGGVDTEASLAH